MHGGKTLVGPTSGRYKTGRYSRYLPEDLIPQYDQAREDQDLLSLHDEISILDVRISGLTKDLHSNDEKSWNKLIGLFEIRRRLVESERKRYVELQQMITAERAAMLITVIINTIKKHVRDRDTFRAIYDDLRGSLGQRSAISA